MDKLLNKIEIQLADMGLKEPLERLALIRRAYSGKEWRLSMVGAFSRGKTHLLNLLLDSDLLPEDVLPSTTVLTEIRYASKISAEFLEKEKSLRLIVNNESLSRFSAGNEFADAEGILKIMLPCDFLKSNIVLYDTPGIDDLLEARADRAFEALEFCDAALVLVSAISPLGLNERQFISEYLNNRENPKLALVVSFLDQLDSRSQEKQLKNIRESARRLYPEIEIWSALPNLPKDLCDVSGIEEIRKNIKRWADDPANINLKKEQERKDVERFMDLVIKLEEGRLIKLKKEESLVQEEKSREKQVLYEKGRDWADIRNNFLDASMANLEKLENFTIELMKTFSTRKGEEGVSRVDLKVVTDELALAAQKNFNEDVAKLLADIRQSYGINADLGHGICFSAVEINEELCPYFSKNNETIRLFLDLMDRHTEELILWLPLPLIGQKIAREIARRFLVIARKKYDDPKQRLEVYKHSISSAAEDLHKMLRDAYADIASKILELREQWLANKQAELDTLTNERGLEKEMSLCAKNIKVLKSLRADLANEAKKL